MVCRVRHGRNGLIDGLTWFIVVGVYGSCLLGGMGQEPERAWTKL